MMARSKAPPFSVLAMCGLLVTATILANAGFAASYYLASAYAGLEPDTGLFISRSDDGIHFTNIAIDSNAIHRPATGVRDPSLYNRDGVWWMVYTYGRPGPSQPATMYLATSTDLLSWTPAVTLQLAAANPSNNLVDIPQWITDDSGNVHLVSCIDSSHHYAEIHPLNSSDASTWGNASNWSQPVELTDVNSGPIVQGNTFIAPKDGVYYMVYDPVYTGEYYLRTSSSLTSGWSAPTPLDLGATRTGGDVENLIALDDDTLRLYISSGNRQEYKIWCLESQNNGATWSDVGLTAFSGYSGIEINWAQIQRFDVAPEPSPLVLSATGLAALLAYAWRRRK
jgi:hypothetical protein